MGVAGRLCEETVKMGSRSSLDTRPGRTDNEPMIHQKLRVFSGRANPELAKRIADQLNDGPGNLRVESFPDTETAVRIDEDVRGRDVFLVQPTCPDRKSTRLNSSHLGI